MRNTKTRTLSQRASLFYDSKKLVWIIICFGIVLRLSQYLFNRSLWLDEAYLTLNIINKSFLELLQSLDYFVAEGCTPITPVGFLMIEKLMVQVFGNNEYALRLFPFLCGIISLFLFYRVATHYIQAKAVPIALGLFAVSDKLIYYSSEIKQYISDVFIALVLLTITIYIQSKRLTASRIVFFGIIGAIAIWFSHPAIFILAGVGTSLILFSVVKKEWPRLARLSIVYSLWILSFAAYYFVSLSSLSNDVLALMRYWRSSFMPFPPMTFSDAKWFVEKFFEIFNDPVGLSLSGIAVLAFIIGCISMFSEKKKEFFVLISPLPFVLLASGLHRYPLEGRLLLFIIPFMLLFIAEGAEKIRVKTSHNYPIIGVTIIGLLVFHPILFVGYHLIKPRTNEEIRPVLSHIREHHQDRDLLYLYYASWPAFEYYWENYGFNKRDYIRKGVGSRDNWSKYIEDLDGLRGNKRVWILFSHVTESEGVNEEKLFLWHLDNIGTRVHSFKAPGATTYLYDLTEPEIDK